MNNQLKVIFCASNYTNDLLTHPLRRSPPSTTYIDHLFVLSHSQKFIFKCLMHPPMYTYSLAQHLVYQNGKRNQLYGLNLP